MELLTQIDIDAPPGRVWTTLTDFDRYYEWNPFMRVAGRANEGARLAVELRPEGAPTARFRPEVVHVDPERELRWLGHLVTPGLYDGEHRFLLEPLSDGTRTRFTQAEQFEGILAGIISRIVGRATERGFEAMNEAMKRRVEAELNGSDVGSDPRESDDGANIDAAV